MEMSGMSTQVPERLPCQRSNPQIPTITLEVDSRARMPEILRVHSPVIRRTVEWWDREMEGEGR
jgi:hypothetical protein